MLAKIYLSVAMLVSAACLAAADGAVTADSGSASARAASTTVFSSTALKVDATDRGHMITPVLEDGTPAGPSKSSEPEKKLTLQDRMMLLALQIGIILFVAKVGGIIATWLKLPSVIGELASGILIGPYALGSKIAFGGGALAKGIFPHVADAGIPVSPELYGFCTLASIVLLFLSGVETNFKMFLKYASSGSIIGLGGVVVSFLFGDLCAVHLLPVFAPAYEGLKMMAPAALFMGIMSTATSVGITARILSERKVLDSPEGTTTMAAAVIDDVLGIIVLAVGTGIVKAQASGGAADWGAIGKISLSAFAYWLGGTAVGLLLARRISWLLKRFKAPVAIATLAFGLSIVLAGCFQAVGLSLIIGAYVMGLSLSRTDIRHLVEENLQPIYMFLVPVFFCVMGMMVDLSAIMSREVLIFGGIYTLLAVLAKVLGCAIPSLFCGFNMLGSLRIGTGMIPRGEVALIIAGIGLSSGYLDNHIFSIGILMTLITTVVSPPLLVALFKTEKIGVRDAARAKNIGSRPRVYTLPNRETAEILLEKLIVAFRQEGFFTALLNPRDRIWQLTREADELNVSLNDNEICFECTPEEEVLVATAMNDVTADLSALAKSLAHPIAPKDVSIQVAAEKPDARASADGEITRCIRSILFIPELRAKTKADAISEIIDQLAKAGKVGDTAPVIEAVLARDEAMSTGLEHGIAIPHARTDLVKGIVGAVALVGGEGLKDYETVDGSIVKIVILTLTEKAAHTPHLRLIAYVSQMLDEEGRAKLLAATTAAEMQKVLLG